MKRSFVAVSVGIASGTMLLMLAFYCMLPMHADGLDYSDPIDEDLAPEIDAVALRGNIHGDFLEVTLETRGGIESFVYSYQVQVIGRFATRPDEPAHVYNLHFIQGWEQNYDIFGYMMDNCLVFSFPLRLMLPNAYVVGLEAFLSGFSDTTFQMEYVNAGNREEMEISYALDLGIDPLILLVAGACCVGAGGILFVTRVGVVRDR